MTNPYTVGQHLRVIKEHKTGGVPPVSLMGEPGNEVVVTKIDGPEHVSFAWANDPARGSRYAHIEWFEAVESSSTFTVGQRIRTREEWNELPLESVCRDEDGWYHRKVADGPEYYGRTDPYPVPARTKTHLDGGEMDFYTPWDYELVLESTPEIKAFAAVEEEEPAPGRPTIDFSGSSRATARQYAENILGIAKLVKSKGILEDVAHGYVVDAYALNAALTAALRAGLNKGRSASDRKDFGREVAYLAHIVQAVLENHADQLPAYVAGQRSRRIEVLSSELDVVQGQAAYATAKHNEVAEELLGVRQAAADYRTQADEEISRLMSLLEQRAAEVAEKQDVNESLTATVEYARALLAAIDEVAAHQVSGFLDAHGLVLNDA